MVILVDLIHNLYLIYVSHNIEVIERQMWQQSSQNYWNCNRQLPWVPKRNQCQEGVLERRLRSDTKGIGKNMSWIDRSHSKEETTTSRSQIEGKIQIYFDLKFEENYHISEICLDLVSQFHKSILWGDFPWHSQNNFLFQCFVSFAMPRHHWLCSPRGCELPTIYALEIPFLILCRIYFKDSC